MAFIGWTNEYILGIPAVDEDHRRLFDLLDDFLAAEHEGVSADESQRRLGRFVVETAEHFRREEQLLDRSDYPGLVGHRAEHERLMAELRHVHERLATGGAEIDQFADFLQSWLRRHILEDDRAYRPFVMRLT